MQNELEKNLKVEISVEKVSEMVTNMNCKSDINPLEKEELKEQLNSMFGQWWEAD